MICTKFFHCSIQFPPSKIYWRLNLFYPSKLKSFQISSDLFTNPKFPLDHLPNFFFTWRYQKTWKNIFHPWEKMWNGKTFPLSPSTEKNLKTVIIKGQTHISYPSNNIKLVKVSQKCAVKIDMELFMQKKCVAHHSA